MRSILHQLLFMLLAVGGYASLTAVAQNNLPSPQIENRANPAPDLPTITQLGLQYVAAIDQPDLSMLASAMRPQQGLISSGLSVPVVIAARVSSYSTINTPPITTASGTEAEGVLIAPSSRQLKLQTELERNTGCEDGTLHGKPCRVDWGRLLSESLFFLASQHGGNIAMDSDTRNQLKDGLIHGTFWSKYAYCVEHYRWSRWKDDDPFGVDYIGHPMMGAVTSSLYEQNDPKQRALMFENTRRYWMGRLRAMAYSAAYSAQWKVGPASEASIGNTGINYYIRAHDGVHTNETGMQDFFITPIGGFAWNIGEDAIDRLILSHVRRGTRNKWLLLASALTTPGKSAANVARFHAPYYRDKGEETAGGLVR